MPVQTPIKGTPRRSPSIGFRESPLRAASRAKPTTSRDHQSTNTTPELPTPRSRAAHWRAQLTQEDRGDPIELRKKLGLLLVDNFGEDFVPRPVQIEALAGLFQLERFKTRNQYAAVFFIAPRGSGKSLIFQAMYLVYGRRAVTIVVSPLTALSQHQAHNLNQERKKAVVICKETWGDGELYQQLSDPSHTVSFIFISPEMHNGDKRWAELISKDSFRERVIRGLAAFLYTDLICCSVTHLVGDPIIDSASCVWAIFAGELELYDEIKYMPELGPITFEELWPMVANTIVLC